MKLTTCNMRLLSYAGKTLLASKTSSPAHHLRCARRVTTGVSTHRVVSPIRFLGKDRFLALCLSREEPRQFYLERCQNVRLAPAGKFVMPVAMAC